MTKARSISDLLDATGDVKSSALDNVPPSDNASSLTTGTLPVARLADGSITSAKLGNDAKVVKSASAPSSPVEGDLWYDTGNEILKIYNSTDSAFVKVVRVTPNITSISGNIVNSNASNLTLNGTGFLSSTLTVSFTPSGGSETTTTVSASNDVSATVAVPSAIYNQAISTVIAIKVTNTDGKISNIVNKTVSALPTGGTISTSGSNRIHTFTSSGTFTNTLEGLEIEYLIVGGGGAGGHDNGGGGGAGGFRTSVVGATSGRNSTAETKPSLSVANYTITVGAGGSPNNSNFGTGNSGSNSSIAGSGITTITSNGGGGATNGGDTNTGNNAADGGCGGGGRGFSTSSWLLGGNGTTGQGFDGGDGLNNSTENSGGGGGAGLNGGNGTTNVGGIGGNGIQSSINGTAYYFSGGGGSGGWNYPAGNGGLGGGAGGSSYASTHGTSDTNGINNASSPSTNGGNGGANTGGGGGGGNAGSTNGGSGGSGIVIVRYQL